jgi:hypothetical protein
MSKTAELVVVKKILKPYRFMHYYNKVRLTTNPQGSWDGANLALEEGWATTEAGWVLVPETFKKKHPGYCLFSRMETSRLPNVDGVVVEAWLYTPTVHSIYKEKENRDLFRCFVDPYCLYEVPLL